MHATLPLFPHACPPNAYIQGHFHTLLLYKALVP
jgi:hypothetical protein